MSGTVWSRRKHFGTCCQGNFFHQKMFSQGDTLCFRGCIVAEDDLYQRTFCSGVVLNKGTFCI